MGERESGGRQAADGWTSVPVDCGPGVQVSLDVFTRTGREAGPTALVIAGIHGDEYEGPAALWEVARSLESEEVAGKVILIPVASPLAFAAGTRTTPPDGLNLARVFPGNAEGSPTERLAHFLFETFGRACDFLIDLHSGGVEYEFLPVAGFRGAPIAENPSYAGARALGLPALWQLPDVPGVFSREVWRIGAAAVGAEYLGAGRLSAEGVRAYARGIRSCLSLWGILRGPVEPVPEPQALYASRWLLCPETGVFSAARRLGETFPAGEELAVLLGTRGDRLAAVTADEPGTVLALRSKAYARQGDWAVLLGRRLDGSR